MRALLFVLVSLLPVVAAAEEKSKTPAPADKVRSPADKAPSQEELEKKFEQMMTGVTLVGHYTVNGKKDASLKTERYKIIKATKKAGDSWIFEANMQWGTHDVTLPMVLTVKWAG